MSGGPEMSGGPGADHLGAYGDWVDEAARRGDLWPAARDGQALRRAVRSMLAFGDDPGRDDVAWLGAQVERTWVADGLRGQEVSWSVGYGPRTRAWVLRPDTDEVLPGVVALHCHGRVKRYGKEKLSDGPGGPAFGVPAVRDDLYDGRAYADDLARRGFVVLVHDVFLWGSRRFDPATMGAALRREAVPADTADTADTAETWARYEDLAAEHEHLVAKYCTVLGTSLAAVVSHEDRLATVYLAGRPDVRADRIGCVGLSGGGARAAFLLATSEHIRAAVVVAMMSTHRALLPQHVAPHTWMFFPPGLARLGDWPDVAACGAPAPLLVQYRRHDELFPPQGMAAAHEHLADRYAAAGAPDAYTGEFYDGGHAFSRPMQDRAFAWLGEQLGRPA